jgi:hypothetical protein
MGYVALDTESTAFTWTAKRDLQIYVVLALPLLAVTLLLYASTEVYKGWRKRTSEDKPVEARNWWGRKRSQGKQVSPV